MASLLLFATPFVDAADAEPKPIPVVVEELPGMTVAYPKGWVAEPPMKKDSFEGYIYYYKINGFKRPYNQNPPKNWASLLLSKGMPLRRADSAGELHPTLQEFRDDYDCETHRKMSTFKGGECGEFKTRIRIAGTDGYLYLDQGKAEVPGSESLSILFLKNDVFYVISFETPVKKYDKMVPYLQSFIEHLVIK